MSTHPDYDHVGGLQEIIETFGADTVYLSPKDHDTDTYINFKNFLADSEIPTYFVNLEGFREDYDWEKVKDKNIPLNQPIYSESGVTVTFLGPVDGDYGKDDTNNYSIVTNL